jgi:hypothetical protein
MILTKHRSAKWIGTMAAILLHLVTAYWLKGSFVEDVNFAKGPNVAGEKILMYPPFSRLGGSRFAVAQERYDLFDDLTDSEECTHRSPIEMYENDKRLGPAHSSREDVVELGHGRFSHLKQNGTTLYWSSSDGSDPNSNGRAYWVVKPAAGP